MEYLGLIKTQQLIEYAADRGEIFRYDDDVVS